MAAWKSIRMRWNTLVSTIIPGLGLDQMAQGKFLRAGFYWTADKEPCLSWVSVPHRKNLHGSREFANDYFSLLETLLDKKTGPALDEQCYDPYLGYLFRQLYKQGKKMRYAGGAKTYNYASVQGHKQITLQLSK